ncbi:MAG: recombinase family protein [candidate division WOR-3 bacterium]
MKSIDVYLYLRFSKDEKEDKKIEEKVQKFLDEQKIYKVIKRFTDDPDSEDRGLAELFNYARVNESVKKVLAYSRENISPDDIFTMWVEKELIKYGVTVRYIDEKISDSIDYEILREKIIGAFARYEKEKLPNKLAAHRVLRTVEKRLKSSGNCPLGYKYVGKVNDKRIVVVKEEAEIVKLIFNKYLEFKSLGRLKEYLQKNNIRTKRGKIFSRQALYNILTNKFYIGFLSYNYYKYIETEKNKRKPVLIEERRVEGKHERIIDREIFEEANRILEENNKHKNDLI